MGVFQGLSSCKLSFFSIFQFRIICFIEKPFSNRFRSTIIVFVKHIVMPYISIFPTFSSYWFVLLQLAFLSIYASNVYGRIGRRLKSFLFQQRSLSRSFLLTQVLLTDTIQVVLLYFFLVCNIFSRKKSGGHVPPKTP